MVLRNWFWFTQRAGGRSPNRGCPWHWRGVPKSHLWKSLLGGGPGVPVRCHACWVSQGICSIGPEWQGGLAACAWAGGGGLLSWLASLGPAHCEKQGRSIVESARERKWEKMGAESVSRVRPIVAGLVRGEDGRMGPKAEDHLRSEDSFLLGSKRQNSRRMTLGKETGLV